MATHRNISMDEREAVASVALRALAAAKSSTTDTNGTLGVTSTIYYYDSDGNLITSQGGDSIVATSTAISETAANLASLETSLTEGLSQLEADYQEADAALQAAYEEANALQDEAIAAAQATADAAANSCASITEDIESIESSLSDASASIAALEEADASLASAVANAQSTADGAQSTADAAASAASEAATAAASASSAASASQELAESAYAAANAAATAAASAQADVDALSEELSDVTVTVDGLATTVAGCVTDDELAETLSAYSTTDQTATMISSAVSAELYDSDGNAIYATTSYVTQTADEIMSNVSATLGDYATTSYVSQTADEIMSNVSATYVTNAALTTVLSNYSTVEQTESTITTTVTSMLNGYATEDYLNDAVSNATASITANYTSAIEQSANGIYTTISETYATIDDLDEEVSTRETLIRETSAGIEVAKLEDGEYTTTRTLIDDGGFYVIDNDTDYTLSALTTGGVTFFDGAGQETDNVTASFNESGSVIGYQSAAHVTTSSAGIEIDDGGGGTLDISSGSMAFSADGVAQATFGSDGTVICPNGVTSAALTQSGLSLYEDGELRLATTSGGVDLFSSESSDDPSLRINSNVIALYDGNGTSSNCLHAYFSPKGCYFYDADANNASARVTITSDGLYVLDGSGTTSNHLCSTFTANGAALYATAGVLGATATSDGFTAYYPDGSTAGLVAGSNGLYIYDDDGTPRVATTSKGVSLFGSNSETYPVAQINSSYIALGTGVGSLASAANRTAYFGTAGVYLYGTNGSSYPRCVIDDRGMFLGTGNGSAASNYIYNTNRRAWFCDDGVYLYDGSSNRYPSVVIDSNGFFLYDGTGVSESDNLASFTADGISIGGASTLYGPLMKISDGQISCQFANGITPNIASYPFIVRDEELTTDDALQLFRVSATGNVGMAGSVYSQGHYYNQVYDSDGTLNGQIVRYCAVGQSSVTVSTAGSYATSSAIYFDGNSGADFSFASAPKVFCQVYSTTSAAVNVMNAGVMVRTVGTTSFTVRVTCETATTIYFYWTAIGKIADSTSYSASSASTASVAALSDEVFDGVDTGDVTAYQGEG